MNTVCLSPAMNDPQTHAIVSDLYYLWLDQIDVRNTSKYGTAKHAKAEATADEYENKASMLVFGDHLHTMTECFYGREEER